jgi:LmbE family N-acetylglucosaminyl deacetylase
VILFVSPHLDDIALSCGGLARRLAVKGQRVMVATLCTADRPAGQPLSATAQHVHGEWQLGDDLPYAIRRAEDEAGCAVLGAEPLHLGLLDAIYRHDDAGAPLYHPDTFMGGQVAEHDWQHFFPALKTALQPLIRSAQRVYAPLSIGGHVDHVLARQAIEETAGDTQVAYYEDYPYAGKTDWQNSGVTMGLAPATLSLSEDEIATRILAISQYPSQMFALFGQEATMPGKVRQYVGQAGGERYWLPIDAFRQDE